MITQKEVKKLFDYDPDTGILSWKVARSNSINVGDEAGSNHNKGYRKIRVNNKYYLSHVVIWLWYYGYIPENDIDHKDRNKKNNKIDNLREVSKQCNSRNTPNQSNNTSGVKGVSFHNNDKKWQSHITIYRKNKYLGSYDDFDEAVCVRLAGEQCLEWSGCDDSSPAYEYVKDNIQNNVRICR